VKTYDPTVPRWTAEIKLQGRGGEPVDLVRTLMSHGVADLLPNRVAEDGSRLATVLNVADSAYAVEITAAATAGHALVHAGADATDPDPGSHDAVVDQVRHMLRLDEDLSRFYAMAAGDRALAWVTAGAGRMLRSPTVFEDVVKTICTTNCAWSGTVRMVSALVDHLGRPAANAPGRRAFPTPTAMAEAPESFYRDIARAGYRGPYLRRLAEEVASRRLDLEVLDDPALPDAEVAERLLALDGVGPYAMAHVMMLLGRYRRLILDSWTRPTYRRLSGRPRVTDKGIVRAFARYRDFAGLAFWLTLTEGWVTEP
jgi:N-glycosylase/DNA lyase